MPRVSAFHGIVIWFFWSDHAPAHFHAQYCEHEAVIELGTLRMIRGKLPRRELDLVRTWARLHETELWANWQRAVHHDQLAQIPPLP
jgi:hypothetical protein